MLMFCPLLKMMGQWNRLSISVSIQFLFSGYNGDNLSSVEVHVTLRTLVDE